MTNTWFIRHAGTLDIDRDSHDILWNQHLIGLHFPWETGHPSRQDSRSLNPEDYSEDNARTALERLATLAADGGYVCAFYEYQPGCKVGYIQPGSSIALTELRWGNSNGKEGSVAVLKTLPLTQASNISATDRADFQSEIPRRGTIWRWRKIGDHIQNLVEERRTGL